MLKHIQETERTEQMFRSLGVHDAFLKCCGSKICHRPLEECVIKSTLNFCACLGIWSLKIHTLSNADKEFFNWSVTFEPSDRY